MHPQTEPWRAPRPPASRPRATGGAPSGRPAAEGPWVVVEGKRDAAAVRRAVRAAQVFVLGTAAVARDGAKLAAVRAWLGPGAALTVLLDPDYAGRQGRALFHSLGGCRHAFLPTRLATADRATRYHEVGNTGVEHARPADVRYALKTARPYSGQRAEFSRADLEELGLATAFNQPLTERTASNARRRRLVCDYWGLGNCDGKQLLKQLNQYSFSRGELQEALAYAEGVLGTQGQAGTQGPPQQEPQGQAAGQQGS